MNDNISRQDAIDTVDDLKACISVDGYWAWMERLKKLPSAQQWIPVSDRLPGYSEKVLVTFYNKYIDRRTIGVSRCYVQKEGFFSDQPFNYTAIAWMPLPEPYAERKE